MRLASLVTSVRDARGLRVLIAATLLVGHVPAGLSQPSNESNANDAVVVFVHGRGQAPEKEATIREKFFHAFAEGQRKLYGRTIVDASDLRFAWYADVIDPGSAAQPSSPNCQFLATKSASAKFQKELRESLIRVAQAAGLDDFGLQVLAKDTYRYLTKPEVRCEADTRLQSILVDPELKGRPIILVAHSMGGLVSFSAIDGLSRVAGSGVRPHVRRFVTLGTQIGLPEVIQGLQGGYVKTPVPLPILIDGWENFRNQGDKLAFATEGSFKATDANREPIDLNISSVGARHAIESYLGNPEVVRTITEAWCKGLAPTDRRCKDVNEESAKDQQAADFSIPAATLTALAHYFGLPEPKVNLTSSPSQTTAVVSPGSYDEAGTIDVNVRQLRDYASAIRSISFDDLFIFSLSHEMAHVKQVLIARTTDREMPLNVSECEADLWAGAAFINVVPLGTNPDFAFSRVLSLVGASAETGSLFPVGWRTGETGKNHPDALVRSLCAAKGVSAGLTMARYRSARLGGGAALKDAAQSTRAMDPEMLQPEDDPWSWSRSMSTGIAAPVDSTFPDTQGMIGRDELLALASATEVGPTALGKLGVLRADGPIAVCHYASRERDTSVRCSQPSLPSDRLAYSSYDTLAGLLRPLLLSRNWLSVAVLQSETTFEQRYVHEAATARVSLNRASRGVSVEFFAKAK